ncbi:MAG: hypothetical protein EOP11_15735 [Proteobacteria bacterium]|nr:MAG: hypothetical protein EOP11_15735 [Pseudomonadota bacterium]
MKLALLAAIALSFVLPAAYAADADEDMAKPNIVYRKKTTVSFDDAVVESTPDNPEGVYVVTPPEKQFGSLLKLRPNFHRELVRDSLLLK